MRLLHVTSVLVAPDALKFVPQLALDRGQWVHAWTAALDDAELIGGVAMEAFLRDAEAVNRIPGETGEMARAWWGCVESWKECKRLTRAKSLRTEVKVGGPDLGWIGRLDNVMARKSREEIWDKKCGPPDSWHGRQTAAYEFGYRHLLHGAAGASRPKRGRFTAHLQADGSFDPGRHLVEHKERHDYRDFLAYLSVAYIDISEGRRPWPARREDETE